MKISDDGLALPPGGKFRRNLGPKNVCFFSLNFTRILRFFWDLRLTLIDIPKDGVLTEILIFSNIFGFPGVNWLPKWTKTVSFGCVPFEPKFKILKDFSNIVFVLLEASYSKFQQKQTISAGVRV